ncbi:hypothetical protein TSOC_001940 [Tetrabaena socialis]|uniref:Uncharacterized protein n=1 Tax=Tetrabaena socialis TaxID=47790 RepID=A0A2J8AFD1_9CHLO|nr:hypothetical protein TSOC_001940 [Tetrabaena socialis]|eukprot:PNH11227.1 hypothetical protein TSOC_001940 [Tetrabaena socialis]
MSAEQQEPVNGAKASDDEPQKQDVWFELFGILQGLAETTALALQAFTPSDDKSVSATTKKRLALRSVQGLKQNQQGLQVLLEHLKALQAASQTWQRTMMYASKGHQELMEQVESSTRELHATSDRLRSVEAHRLSSVREAESLRAQVARLEEQNKGLQSGLKQREEELDTVQFTVHEVQADASATQQRMEQLRQAAEEAAQHAAAATSGLSEARADAAKAQNQAERHQQVVAKLTADNLLFLMQLKKSEADLAAANQERAQLRLAAEQQRGPWFDQVGNTGRTRGAGAQRSGGERAALAAPAAAQPHAADVRARAPIGPNPALPLPAMRCAQVRAGVEERVRQALQRSQELEGRLEQQAAEHGSRIQAIESQRAQLESELSASRGQGAQLEAALDAALAAQQRAQEQGASAEAAAGELRQRLEELSAENRVLQESVRSMRQECTERWVSEQAALGRVGGLEDRLQALEAAAARQAAAAASLQRQLDAQAGVNRQLMARKEEVEWQLMAAKAQLDGGAGEGPVPMNLLVSGLLQVGGGGQEQQRSGAPPPGATPALAGRVSLDAPPQAERNPTPHQPSYAAAGQQHPGSAHAHASVVEPAPHAPAPAPAPRPASAGPPGDSAAAPQQPARLTPLPPASEANPSSRPAEAPTRAPHPPLWQGSTEVAAAAAAGPVLSREPTLSLRDRAYDALPSTADVRGPPAATSATAASAADERSDAWGAGYRAGVEAEGRQWSAAAAGTYGTPVGGSTGAGAGASGVAHLHEGASAGGGSTPAPSSPPSSVALSVDGGSAWGAASRVPSTSSSRMRVAAAAAAVAPAVTIRTGPGVGQPGAGQPGHGASGHSASGGGLGSSRDSLHDGEGMWPNEQGSPARSDDSGGFLFAGGISLQRSTHGARAAAAPPPSHAMLMQLQQELQELQVHPQAPAAVAAAPPPLYDAPAAPLLELRPGVQPLGSWQEYRSWQGGAHAQASPSGGGGGGGGGSMLQARAPAPDADGFHAAHRPSGSRPSIVMRTGPSRAPGASASGRSAGGSDTRAPGDSVEVGVFSIIKTGAAMSPARASGAGSPVHPAFRPRAAPQQQSSPGRQPEGQQQQQQQARADMGSPSAAAAPAPPAPGAASGLADGGSGGWAAPLRVQAGPPYYATAGPLGRQVTASLERWPEPASAQPEAHAQAGTGSGGQRFSEAALHPPQPAPQPALPLLEGAHHVRAPAPASSARASAAPPSPPRSPPHPAVYLPGGPPPAGSGRAAEPAASGAGGPAQGASLGDVGWSGGVVAAPQGAQGPPDTAGGAPGGGAASAAGAGGTSLSARPRVSFQGHTQLDEAGSLQAGSGGAKSVRFSDQGGEPAQGPELTKGAAPAPGPAAASSRSPPPGSYRPLGAAVQHPALMGAASTAPTGAPYSVDPADTTPSKRYSAARVAVTSVPRGGGV